MWLGPLSAVLSIVLLGSAYEYDLPSVFSAARKGCAPLQMGAVTHDEGLEHQEKDGPGCPIDSSISIPQIDPASFLTCTAFALDSTGSLAP